MNFVVIDLLNIFLMIAKIYIYRLYQLGIEGRTQKAKPVQGVYPKPSSLRNKRLAVKLKFYRTYPYK